MDIFLKFGAVKGDSKATAFNSEIKIRSWSFGASVHLGAEKNNASKVVRLDSIVISKTHDVASGGLIDFCLKATHAPLVTISLAASGKAAAEPFCTVKLEDVLITSYSTSFTEGVSEPIDQIVLSYSKIDYEYKGKDTAGKVSGTGTFKYNLPTTAVG